MSEAWLKIWKIRFFFGSVLVFVILGMLVLFTSGKVESHLWFNSMNTPALDVFFKYLTFLGDGNFVAIGIIVLGILGYKNKRWYPFVYGGALLILSGAAAQFLKRIVFHESLRPTAFLSDFKLHLIEGVDMHQSLSFPSGHTTAGFAFFGFLAMRYFSEKPLFQISMAVIAALVGYSRIYLSQHFLEDVITGMLLASFCLVLIPLIDRKHRIYG